MPDQPCILSTRHDSDQVVLDSPYRADFVEALKRAVPHVDRRAVYEEEASSHAKHGNPVCPFSRDSNPR